MNGLLFVARHFGGILAEKRSSFIIIGGQIRSYSLSYEAVEKIKSQLDLRDARLVTPQDADPSSDYKGLVILAAGPIAKYRALEKFSAPYLECGLPVITMNRSVISWAFCTPAERKMNRVFNVVSSNLTEPCSVVFKLYCTASTTYLPAAAKELSKRDCKLKLAGAIFDSGPTTMKPRDIINLGKFFSSRNRYPTWFDGIKELSIPFLLAAINGSRKAGAMERVMHSPFLNHIPQLYVYSRKDDIITVDYITNMIDNQQQHNADVTKHVFNDTDHMLHRLKYPMEYDNLLIDFLGKKCSLPILETLYS